MNCPAIDCQSVSFRYSRLADLALTNVSTQIVGGSMTGLLGRNGAGKTTLARLIAGFEAPSSGAMTIDGRSILDDVDLASDTCLVWDRLPVLVDRRIEATLALWASVRPNWDGAFARELFDAFSLTTTAKPSSLSKGQFSALAATLGLASRCSVTVFDEIHLGMDAVTRELFYRFLLTDYAKHPRTVVVSSHLIDEIESLLSHVLILDRGSVMEAGEVDDVRERHSTNGSLPSLAELLMDSTITPQQRAMLQGGDPHEH